MTDARAIVYASHMQTELCSTETMQPAPPQFQSREIGFASPGPNKPGQISFMNSNGEAASETEAVVPASLPAVPPVRARILVVEDNPNIRRLNAELLTDSGY